MLEDKPKEQQSGFSVLSTDELYEVNGGDGEFEPAKLTKTSKSSGGIPSQGPTVAAGCK